MLNVHELEKRWISYKIKSLAPYIVAFLTVVLLGTSLFFFLPADSTPKDETQELNSTLKTEKKEHINIAEKQVVEQKSTPTEEPKLEQREAIAKQALYNPQQKNDSLPASHNSVQKEHVLQPEMDFIYNIKKSAPKQHYKAPTKPKPKPAPKKRVAVQTNSVKEEYIDLQEEVTTPKERQQEVVKEKSEAVQITIKRRESQKDIQEVIARFQKNNNPALSLFVAKKYYELGNYKQAYNYALVTNKINSHIEQSWLIFAKSLVKLGKKEQAIRTLQEYIKYSHSSNAQVLLDEIQRGKFK
jgi:tetratricopeptide (TPR) repeat protein